MSTGLAPSDGGSALGLSPWLELAIFILRIAPLQDTGHPGSRPSLTASFQLASPIETLSPNKVAFCGI